MDIQGIAGNASQLYDTKTFGAAVVGKTIEYLNGTSSPADKAFDKETFDAALVTMTIDTMNKNEERHKDHTTYTFQKDVLMPAYTGQGTILDSLV